MTLLNYRRYRRNRRHTLTENCRKFRYISGCHPVCHTYFPNKILASKLSACRHLRKCCNRVRPCCLSVNCNIVLTYLRWRRRNRLIQSAQSAVHHSCNILPDCTPHSHARHHAGRIKTAAVTKIYAISAVAITFAAVFYARQSLTTRATTGANPFRKSPLLFFIPMAANTISK